MSVAALTGNTPREILEHLVRFPTVNPPGNERDCVFFVRDLLHANGIEVELLTVNPGRPNLVARLQGRGE